MQFVNIEQAYTTFYVFCGMGGAAVGAQQAEAEYRGLRGRAVVLGGIDVDPLACADFEMWTGVPATCLDLFDRQQYIDWHGHEPPEHWREADTSDILTAAQGRRPNAVIITAPCKGFSGLLSEEKSQSRRYQALNRLTERGVFLTLETWKDDPPEFLVFENVPRIATRGRKFLDGIKKLLRAYGYVFHESHHLCGELGGLAQPRRRYLLVARLAAKVPTFLYNPPRQRIRAIGEVLGGMPMPDDPAAGPLHRLPRLTWKTWVRLALIPPGGDWRDLQKVEPGKYLIQPYMRDGQTHPNKYQVLRWDETAPTVTGSRLGSGAPAVADVRLGHTAMGHGRGAYWLQRWDDPSGTITADPGHRKSGGASLVADPRIGHTPRDGSMRVGAWDQPASSIVGSAAVTSSNSIGAVADPRYTRTPRAGVLSVQAWDRPSHTVTGGKDPNGNMLSVADPRGEYYGNMLRVTPWSEPANTVTGAAGPNQGATLVADPRMTCAPRNGTMGVIGWDQPAGTVIGSGDVHAGAAAVADPRIPADDERGIWVIVSPWGFWHRPLTTLELLALQGFPWKRPDGSPIVLAGRSDRAWRERIGNAVPPPTMKAIMEQMIYTMLASETNDWRMDVLQTGIWVRPEEADQVQQGVGA